MNLQLSLKKKWFEMTKAGIKTEDYREINKHWIQRLVQPIFNRDTWRDEQGVISHIIEHRDHFSKNRMKYFSTNKMTLGYPKSTDTEKILEFKHAGIEIREGNPEWGAEPGKLYFVIKHGN
ncbi:hypothetical protein [Chryseobacterium sp. 2VB]|uniref:hypothetical protein n=1 Tax=Chryseobacterium sp. 2VB TaxID=2502204 RepID=UPI0010F5F4F5|nr:hypothetical protein [Chryseobacterium sp. 2VB]